MGVLYFLDDLGNALLCRPMSKAHKFRFLNFFDDMGIFFVCKPMGYIDSEWPVEGVVLMMRDLLGK
ncbi:hypothetical protein M430DRAFT_35697 [Amorphotheca resinae ATCC 22711]|uniref:Uncharacterized protein n=1 Tax=Amorphotheca resinae ATCC 22711 TaxID=857342 RepID=A0A2T3AXM8_AMORE|nr:hypothetical protein M430DRAFT_35697 [Amorphotheca resinae ATCC 22711]PSS14815.1 hypothetical protein M430DRAFT_35697 [Amorphotheca resinae ATCC 22711]